MNIPNPYLQLRSHVDELARQLGRDPSTILLVAASKGYPISAILTMYEAGCRDFGESRVQDYLGKINEAPDDINWHFIGSLQSNKVNKVVGEFAMIHSVDSISLAKKISQCSLDRGVITSILLEVNTSGEKSKHGFTPEQCRQEIASVFALPGLSVRGLMTMAPLTEEKNIVRRCFADLRKLRDEIISKETTPTCFKELSMGMSHDYPEAIAEGATILRIGTAIFN